ncbi:hypothetical protein KAR91_04650 [Candidatus Pacearchaeota archaeon]|nr:hypothetical protein [Candidatus Pacearchaeota archaeon]
MKCMNPKCDSEEFSLVISSSLTNHQEQDDYWVSCDGCGMSSPICNSMWEAREFFEEEIPEYKPEPNLELKTFPSSGPAWSNKTGKEILEDIERVSNEIRQNAKPEHDLKYDAMGRLGLVYNPPSISEMWNRFFGGQRLAEPFDVDIDIAREPLVKDQWSAAKEGLKQLRSYEEAGQKKGILFEKFQEAVMDRISVSVSIPKEMPSQNIEVEVTGLDTDHSKEIDDLAEHLAPTTPMSKDDAKAALKALENTGVKGTESGVRLHEMMREISIMKGAAMGATEITGFSNETEAKSFIESHISPVDTDQYPHQCDCGSKCYNNGMKIECTNQGCIHGVKT